MPHPDHFHDDDDDDEGAHDDAERSLLPLTYDNGNEEEEGYARPRSQSRRVPGYVRGPWSFCRGRRRQTAQEDAGSTRQRGFFPVVRTFFNYPEPGTKVRPTGWLDGLRGVAAFQVFIYHYADQWLVQDMTWGAAPDNNPHAWWAATMFRLWWACGGAAVCLFFTISGYALTTRTLGQIRRGQLDGVLNSLSSAVLRRGIRLYLPVMITTFLIMSSGWWFGGPKCTAWEPAPTYFLEIWRWYDFVMKSWMPLRYPDRVGELFNGYDGAVSWTIPLEYYGSIVTFVAILFTAQVTRFSVRTALFAVFIYMYTLKDEWYVVQFLVGAIYAEYQLREAEQNKPSNGQPQRSRLQSIIHKACVVAMLVFGLHMYSMPLTRLKTAPDEHPAVLTTRPTWDWIVAVPQYIGWYDKKGAQVDRFLLGLGANCVLIGIGETAALRGLLHTRPLQYLGRISFGLYLSHKWVREFINPFSPLLLTLVGLDNKVAIGDQPVNWRYALAYWIRIIVAIPINFAVAGAFERTIDRWSVDLGKKFEQFVKNIGGAGGAAGPVKPVELASTSRPVATEGGGG